MSKSSTTLATLTNRVRSDIVRIKVVDKQTKQESASKVTYQRMVFSDAEGTKLTATLFGIEIDVYEDILKRGRHYDIRNMLVKEVPPRFASYEGEKQLYFTNSTEVIPIEFDEGSSSTVVSPYTLIKSISADASTDDRFDMVMLVLDIHGEKMVAKGPSLLHVRELTAIDASVNHALLVSAWNRRMIDFFDKIELVLVEDPVIEFIGLIISRFTGFSLATSLSTEVKLHPKCGEAVALRKWAKDNLESVRCRPVCSLQSACPGYPQPVTPITAALSMVAANVPDTAQLRIRAHIPEIRYDDVRLTIGCRGCGKSCLDDPIALAEDYHCEACLVTTKAETRLYFRFKCTDGTSTLTLDTYTRSAERLLHITSEKFLGNTEEERRSVLAAAEAHHRANTVDLIIIPAKSLLVYNKRLKWILKDVVI